MRWYPAENGGWCIITTTGPVCSLTRATSHLNSSSEYLTCALRDQWLPGSTMGFVSSAMKRPQPSAESKQ